MRLLVALVAVVLAVPAHANVGRRYDEGSRNVEPLGLKSVAIDHEDLRFDLRSLERGDRQASVSATYHLENRGADAVSAPLVFVGGGQMTVVDITFDKAPIAGTRLDDAELAALPAAWRAPITTPAIDGEALAYATDDASAVAFALVIPSGRHELTVTYGAKTDWRKEHRSPTVVYQLGYVLAPARDWGAFGKLDVTVDVPSGWRVATSPALARSGDTLRGSFTGLPADTLGIAVRAPTSTLHEVLQYALPLLAVLVLVGGAFAMYRIGRARSRADDLRPLWPVSLPASLGWAVAIAVSGGFAGFRASLALPAAQDASSGYDGALVALLAFVVAIIAIPVGMLIARAGSHS
jgi:hypothetical protein